MNRKVLTKKNNEIFIRNARRAINKSANYEPYQPEYQRLDKDPKVNKVSSTDFINKRPKVSTFVHSGQNNELLWNKSEQEPVVEEQNDIDYEDVRLPPQKEFEHEQEIIDFEEADSVFNDMAVGEYILLYGSDILEVGSKEQIIEAVEDILLSREDGEQIYNHLRVLKRINIATGIFLTDE